MMLRRFLCMAWVALMLGTAVTYGRAQTGDHDPLNNKEVDEMRESADFPDKRIELLVKFARVRVSSIEQLRSTAKGAEDRPAQIHDLLQDFSSLLDELDDNVEVYTKHRADMRKGLKLLIEAISEWQLKLRNLKEQSAPDDLAQYSFVLANTTDALQDSAESARTALQQQNELAKRKELQKVYSERKD
jgi:hypothetical protein